MTAVGAEAISARRAALVALVAVTAACGGAVPPVESHDGAAWRELTSEHFTVWTDAESGRVRELIASMERIRRVVVGVAFPHMPDTGRDLVIVLADDGELTALSLTDQPRPYSRSPGPPLWQPMMLLSAFSNSDVANVSLPHELTHTISFGVIPGQPRWLSEGMAQFFETMQFSRDGQSVDVGVAPNTRGQARRLPHLTSIASVLTWAQISEHEGPEYTTAWALFTFLLNTHRDELTHYFELLAAHRIHRGDAEEATQMWAAAFPSLPLAEVDTTLRQWLVTGNHDVLHLNVAPRPTPIAERALGVADGYAIRGMLLVAARDGAPKAREDFAAALRAEPTNVLANLYSLVLYKAIPTPPQARAIVAAHAGDWRALWLAAEVLYAAGGDAAELTALRTKACRLIGHNHAIVEPPTLVRTERGAASPEGCSELLRAEPPAAPEPPASAN